LIILTTVADCGMLVEKRGARVSIRPASTDDVLTQYRSELERLYGDRVQRVILFGSRARGEARDDSDYDVAVFLKDMDDRWKEFDRLADLETRLILDRGAVIHAIPYAVEAYHERTPLMGEIRAEGIEV
jgi:predicted nucleotidyltransferase